jgi:hypothetical protein
LSDPGAMALPSFFWVAPQFYFFGPLWANFRRTKTSRLVRHGPPLEECRLSTEFV